MYKIKLENFEGPLDLLLFFVRRDELNIYDIPIAHITKSYLEYLRMMQELNLDVAGEFILMAATLMRIKVRSMLPPDPSLEEEEEIIDPRLELTQRLIEYRQFKEASKTLSALDEEWRQIYRRSYFNAETLPPPEAPETMALKDISFFDLLAAYKKAVTKSAEMVYHNVERLNVTMEGQKQYIADFFGDRQEYLFSDLCEGMCKIEIVVTFLALLDMIKQEEVLVRQAVVFDDIWIRKPGGDITQMVQDLSETPVTEKPFEFQHASVKEFVPVDVAETRFNGHDDETAVIPALTVATQEIHEWIKDETPENQSSADQATADSSITESASVEDNAIIGLSSTDDSVMDGTETREAWIDEVAQFIGNTDMPVIAADQAELAETQSDTESIAHTDTAAEISEPEISLQDTENSDESSADLQTPDIASIPEEQESPVEKEKLPVQPKIDFFQTTEPDATGEQDVMTDDSVIHEQPAGEKKISEIIPTIPEENIPETEETVSQDINISETVSNIEKSENTHNAVEKEVIAETAAETTPEPVESEKLEKSSGSETDTEKQIPGHEQIKKEKSSSLKSFFRKVIHFVKRIFIR